MSPDVKAHKYRPVAGVALGLVRRGAILFSTLIGPSIVIWSRAEGSAKRLADSRDSDVIKDLESKNGKPNPDWFSGLLDRHSHSKKMQGMGWTGSSSRRPAFRK